MAAVDKDKLLSRRLDEGDVDIAGLGTVVVRGLSRTEVFAASEESDDDRSRWEALVIAAGMVAPALTVDEVETWRANAPSAEVRRVSDKILALSGIGKEVAASTEKRFPADSDGG